MQTYQSPVSRGVGGFYQLVHIELLTRITPAPAINLSIGTEPEECDFLYVYNPNGQIGSSAALEIGYALKCNTPIISLEKPEDVTLSKLVEPVSDLKKFVSKYNGVRTLADIQEFCDEFVIDKGFSNETIPETLMLLQEEIGELARSIRTIMKIKSRSSTIKTQADLADEVADCLMYLAILSNKLKINLEDAFKSKQLSNFNREWE